LGLGHRVGSLKPGYDADVVIWDRNPLSLGAAPLQVFVDGIPQFEKRKISPVESDERKVTEKSAVIRNKEATANSKSFVLTNVGKIYLKQKQAAQGKVIVDHGKVVCAGDDCDVQLLSLDSNLPEIDINGGYVMPVSFFQQDTVTHLINTNDDTLSHRVLLRSAHHLVLLRLMPRIQLAMVKFVPLLQETTRILFKPLMVLSSVPSTSSVLMREVS
jgi:hypothetical protein